MSDRVRISAEQIRREVFELIGYPEGRGGVSVRVSIVLVEPKHASAGSMAKLHIDIGEGARRVDLVLMLERLYMSLDDFRDLVLAPVFLPARDTPATKPRGHDDGEEETNQEEHGEEAHAAVAPL